jgi:ATP-binding cassette, subfamily B, bacterial MsbA
MPIQVIKDRATDSISILNWRRVFNYLKPYWRQMLLATGALLITMACGLIFPIVIAQLLASITSTNKFGSLNKLTLLLIGIFLAQAAFSFIQSYYLTRVGEHIVYDLRTSLYDQLQNLSLDFFATFRTGDILSRLTNDVTQIRLVLTSGLATSLNQIITLIGALTIISLIDRRLTLFIFAVAPVVIIFAIVFGHFIQKGSAGIQDELARSTVVAEETLQGARVVKVFGQELFEMRRFAVAARATLRASIYQDIYNSSFNALMMFLGLGSIAVIIWYAGLEVIAGRLSLPTMTGFLMYGMMIAGSMTGLTRLYGQLREVAGGVQRVFQILDLRPTVLDSAQAVTMPVVRGQITFNNVFFGYEENISVLQGITLDIQAGEILAVIGPNGAGKSTLFNLIPRLYDPMSGSIQIDGIDLRAITQSSLRAQLAIVPQETILFGGTIRENILYGRLGATEAEVILAAKNANAHEFIMHLRGQYDTVVGDRGAKLSGGQRQRIAISRALLRNPRILLLDEATNFLDDESEQIVQETLNRVMRGRTTIIIAHRLSTVKTAHRIAVLDRGRIAELGSHDELMKLNGRYARCYGTQFSDLAGDCSEQFMDFANFRPTD